MPRGTFSWKSARRSPRKAAARPAPAAGCRKAGKAEPGRLEMKKKRLRKRSGAQKDNVRGQTTGGMLRGREWKAKKKKDSLGLERRLGLVGEEIGGVGERLLLGLHGGERDGGRRKETPEVSRNQSLSERKASPAPEQFVESLGRLRKPIRRKTKQKAEHWRTKNRKTNEGVIAR